MSINNLSVIGYLPRSNSSLVWGGLLVGIAIAMLGLLLSPGAAGAQTTPPQFLFKWGSVGSGDGQFITPLGAAVDSSGNVYVADTGNHRIQKFDSSGNLLLVWGWGVTDGTSAFQTCFSSCQTGIAGNNAGQFFSPFDVTVDSSGDVYVSELGIDRIQKFTSSGAFITEWSTFVPIFDPSVFGIEPFRPGSIAVDSSGNVYIADMWAVSVILKFDNSGNFIGCLGGGISGFQNPCNSASDGFGDGRLNAPLSVAVDSLDNIYVAELSGNRIQKFNSAGVFQGWLGKCTSGTDCDTVNQHSNGFNCTAATCSGLAPGGGDGQLYVPTGITIDSFDNIYVSNNGPDSIQKFDSIGNFLAKWGSFCNLSTTSGCVDPDGAGPLVLGDGEFYEPRDIAIDSSGNVYIADLNNHRIQVFAFPPTKISAGGFHNLTLRSDGTVWAWGGNQLGQLGDRTTTSRTTPVLVSGLSNIVDIAAGNTHSLALKSDGTVWAWGANNSGQLGDGTTIDRTTPVLVSGLSNIIDIVSGSLHSMALKADGTVWAWGWNAHGQLGDGTITDRTTPVPVSGLDTITANIVEIAAGGTHSMALKNGGTVWAWGGNQLGQLGDGTNTNRTTLVLVSGLSNIVDIAAGSLHSMALKSDDTSWAWGRNNFGQLGDGTTTDRTTPVLVSGLSNIFDIAAGSLHSMALKNDGTVLAWGSNQFSQLGDGTTTDRTTPVLVSGFSGVTQISAGQRHSMALACTPSAWGMNNFGQLGDGTTTNRITPIQVSDFNNICPPLVTDSDGDGIFDDVDTLLNTPSSEFSDIPLGDSTTGLVTAINDTSGTLEFSIIDESIDGVRVRITGLPGDSVTVDVKAPTTVVIQAGFTEAEAIVTDPVGTLTVEVVTSLVVVEPLAGQIFRLESAGVIVNFVFDLNVATWVDEFGNSLITPVALVADAGTVTFSFDTSGNPVVEFVAPGPIAVKAVLAERVVDELVTETEAMARDLADIMTPLLKSKQYSPGALAVQRLLNFFDAKLRVDGIAYTNTLNAANQFRVRVGLRQSTINIWDARINSIAQTVTNLFNNAMKALRRQNLRGTLFVKFPQAPAGEQWWTYDPGVGSFVSITLVD